MNTELLKSKLLEAAFNGSLTHADTSKWEHKHLKDTCNHQNGDRGKNYPSKNKLSHEGIPFISALNLSNNTVIDDDKLLKMSDEQFNKLGNGKLNKGDFVLCIRGSVGKHGIYPFDKGAIASSLVILRPNEDKLNLMWLSYYFDSSLFRENLLDSQNGTAQPNLAAKELMQFLIPLPPLHEQERIVSALEEGFAAIDAIAEAKANLSNTAEMLRSKILQAAFDGSLTGADISKWEHRQLREISTKIVDGDHNPPKGQKNPTPHIMLSSQNINENKFVAMNKVRYLSKEDFAMCHKRTNLTKGDVLLTSVGTVGRSCVHDSDEKYCFQRSVTIITPTINSYFLKYYFDSPAFQQMLLLGATGNAQKGFYLNQLKEVIIPLPPLAEQERIVAKIESLFTEIDKLSK